MDVSESIGVEGVVGRSPAYTAVDLDKGSLVRLGLPRIVLLEVVLGVIVLGNNGVRIWLVGFCKAFTVNFCKRASEYIHSN